MCFSLHMCHLRLMWIMIVLSLKIKTGPFFKDILVKFTYLVGMIADQNFYDICFLFFYPTASATAEGENCAYSPTLVRTLIEWLNST